MPTVTQFAAWAAIALVAGFAGVVCWKLLAGDIPLDWLLYGDARGLRGAKSSTFFSAGRAQMLITTLAFSVYFLTQVIHDPTKFPDVPNTLLGILGGSHVVYLGGKAQALYFGRLRDLSALLGERNENN